MISLSRFTFLFVCAVSIPVLANDNGFDPQTVVDQAQKTNSLLKQTDGPILPCPGGCTTPSPIQYEVCSAKNDYFEDAYSKITSTGAFQLLKSSVPPDLTLNTCIRESQNAHAGPFRTCDSKMKFLSKKNVSKACQSENSLTIETSTFSATVDCLNEFMNIGGGPADKDGLSREMFSLISIESGFHDNAVSGTGSSGIGQLTHDASIDMNHLGWDDMIGNIKASSKPSCQAISQMNPQPFNGAWSDRCEMISPQKGNPLNNLLYTFFYQKQIREQVAQSINSLRDSNKGKLAFKNSSEKFQNQLISVVSLWGHNTGPAGIRMPLKNLLSSKIGQQLLKNEDLNGIFEHLSNLVDDYELNFLSASPERAHEASHYLKNIKARLAYINEHAGSSEGALKCGF